MTYKAFLIKYAEIAIKGKNRYLFEDALVSQMNHALKKVDGTFHIRKEQGRIYVEMEGEYDYDGAVEALQHVFGIVGICPVVLLEALMRWRGKSSAISTRYTRTSILRSRSMRAARERITRWSRWRSMPRWASGS